MKSNLPFTPKRIIAIGASAGGVNAMLKVAAQLPASFPAPILLVQHVGAHPSILPDLLAQRGPNSAKFGEHGEIPMPGTIYVAPSDRHMLIEQGRIRVWKGPKEQFHRPAINPLLRSVALNYGQRAIGVILTGMLDDGASGLKAIKECGGIAVVQDPLDAEEPSMPWSALAAVDSDYVCTLDALPALLYEVASMDINDLHAHQPQQDLLDEHEASFGDPDLRRLKKIGVPSTFTCPDCGGALFELNDKKPLRYLCYTGHAYTARALDARNEQTTDFALWSSLRALQERRSILERLIEAPDVPLGEKPARLLEMQKLTEAINALRTLVEDAPEKP